MVAWREIANSFGASAFAKRYVDEPGTHEVIAWCERAHELALSVMVIPEIVSAFCRLQREARLDDAQFRQLKQDLMVSIADALICDTVPQVIQYVVNALEACALHGMDAIHIGAALACAAEAFAPADVRQCEAAKHFGLQVVVL